MNWNMRQACSCPLLLSVFKTCQNPWKPTGLHDCTWQNWSVDLNSISILEWPLSDRPEPLVFGDSYSNFFQEFAETLRIMGSQNKWFGDPRTLLYTSIHIQTPLFWRVQWFLGCIYIYIAVARYFDFFTWWRSTRPVWLGDEEPVPRRRSHPLEFQRKNDFCCWI